MDKHISYIGVADKIGIDLKQIDSASKVDSIYHIQHINFHRSRLKSWMECFKDISTKYLVNYMYWFKFFEDTKNNNDNSRIISLFKDCSKLDYRETVNNLRKRPPSIA